MYAFLFTTLVGILIACLLVVFFIAHPYYFLFSIVFSFLTSVQGQIAAGQILEVTLLTCTLPTKVINKIVPRTLRL